MTIGSTSLLPLGPVSPGPSPSNGPTCDQASDLCHRVYEITKQAWLAESSYYIIVKPFRILLILIIAMVVRHLLYRTINRLIKTTASGGVPTVLKPLRERLPSGLQEATTLFPERRIQRAEAIGSVLRSTSTLVIYSIAVLLILSELGVNLAPLLASAGVAGIALGFGAQSLVKDILAGLFMLLEDQYGVGDVIDVGETVGTVEAVGLRITTIRDIRGVLWYVRNGEIVKVGNKSQGWASVIVDMPIGFASVEEATAVLRRAAETFAEDPEYADEFLEPPTVVGVEQMTVEGAVVRTTARVPADDGPHVTRELRRRMTEALETAGVTTQIAAASRIYPRAAAPGLPPVSQGEVGGPT